MEAPITNTIRIIFHTYNIFTTKVKEDQTWIVLNIKN